MARKSQTSRRRGDVLSLLLLKSIAKGKVTFPGNPDTMQPYALLPDWARGAVGLADKSVELSQFEDVPLGGLAFTANELAAYLQHRLGRKVTVGGFPWWLMRMASPFWELARELVDMRYLWSTDHRLGTTKLQRLLPGFTVTPMQSAIDAWLPADIRPNKPVPTYLRVPTG